jgi:hypothetical protein
MQDSLPLYLALALSMLTVLLPLYYLRPAIQRVLKAACKDNDTGAVFWLRAMDVLAYTGSLMLVLIFGKFDGDIQQTMRLTILLSLAGVFVSVLFVTANVWQVVVAPAIKTPAAPAPERDPNAYTRPAAKV